MAYGLWLGRFGNVIAATAARIRSSTSSVAALVSVTLQPLTLPLSFSTMRSCSSRGKTRVVKAS
jgi:hypothetical protein